MKYNEIQEDYKLYQSGMDYNRRLSPAYYPTIDVNEAFYANDQWRGVDIRGVPALILPIYERIADHEIASILSSPIKAKFSVENFDSETDDLAEIEKKNKVDMLNYKIEDKWEKDKIDSLLREALIDGFNSGDYAIYTYWDKNKRTKQYYGVDSGGSPMEIMGDFCNELKDGSEIMFGNPNDRRVQSQPYILVLGRSVVSDLKNEAKSNKVPKDEYENITGDLEYNEQSGDRGKIEIDNTGDNGKCLYIIKLWKKDGQVYYRKSTKYCTIIKEQPMNLKRYPIAWGNWIKRKNCYHGTAPGTAIVPNQIAINQMYSNVSYMMKQTAYGKVIYDKTRIDSWSNAIGSAIPVTGDVTGAVQQLPPGQMNNNIFGFMSDLISTSKELHGANDAALGDVNPEQASGAAIAATAQQNAIPLENPKQNLYQFVEDLILNWQDFIENQYKVPRKVGYKDKGIDKVGELNGEDYQNIPLSLKIDVGPSQQWSEITNVNTIMTMLREKQISLVQALERIPDGYITDKQGLIEEIKQQEEMMMQQQQADQQNQMIMQDEQMQAEQQSKEQEYEQMASFVETLPADVQEKLQALPPEQMEKQVLQLMKQSVNQSMNNGGGENV